MTMATKIKTNPPMKTISEFVSRNSWIYVVLAFLVLLMMAFGLDKKVPRPAILNRLTARARFKACKLSAYGGASAMGLLTPFLPCGPLYLVLGAALLAGSAAKGAEFTLAFGLGTVPLLWLAQSQFQWVRTKLSPLWLARTRAVLALIAAAVVGWRLRATIGFPGPDPSSLICF